MDNTPTVPAPPPPVPAGKTHIRVILSYTLEVDGRVDAPEALQRPNTLATIGLEGVGAPGRIVPHSASVELHTRKTRTSKPFGK